jgi:hypothetical protein
MSATRRIRIKRQLQALLNRDGFSGLSEPAQAQIASPTHPSAADGEFAKSTMLPDGACRPTHRSHYPEASGVRDRGRYRFPTAPGSRYMKARAPFEACVPLRPISRCRNTELARSPRLKCEDFRSGDRCEGAGSIHHAKGAADIAELQPGSRPCRWRVKRRKQQRTVGK